VVKEARGGKHHQSPPATAEFTNPRYAVISSHFNVSTTLIAFLMSVCFVSIKDFTLTGLCCAPHPEPRIGRCRGEDVEDN
jgi:hypothetical protein